MLIGKRGSFAKVLSRTSLVLASGLLVLAVSGTDLWIYNPHAPIPTVSIKSRPASGQNQAKSMETAAIPLQIRAEALKQIAQKLAMQRDAIKAGTRNQTPGQFSSSNLDKLQPAILRQRTVLLTPRLMDQKPVEETIEPSDDIVGSIAPVPIIPNKSGPLDRFHSSLAALKSGKRASPLTILHVGDAAGVSDTFVDQLRNELQDQYGNAGRGMVLPAMGLQQDEQLEVQSLGTWRRKVAGYAPSENFGLSGVSATSRSSLSSMTVTSKTEPFDWVEVTVVTGPSQGQILLEVNDQKTLFDAHSRTRGSRTFRVNAKSTTATIRPGGGARTSVLNLSAGRKTPGIRLVSFDVADPRQLDQALLGNDIRTLDPELIIYSSSKTPVTKTRMSSHARVREIADQIGLFMEHAVNAELVLLSTPAKPIYGAAPNCKTSTASTSQHSPSNLQTLAMLQRAAHWTLPAHLGTSCDHIPEIGETDQLVNGLSSIGATTFANWLTKPGASNKVLMLSETRF
ncbi:MAG: hypothetical protein ACR2O8_10410 [Rhizobiaceae bacterium]